jgi:rRNA maturation endonuclease Nob1
MPIAGSLSNTSNGSNLMNVSSKIETGRIEKGGSTKQKFETDNGSYNVFYSELLAIKLLPSSAKPIEVSEIRTYCTGCGTRMKKQTWKFCPNCGTKID